MAIESIRREQIKQVFQKFLRNRARTIRRLKIEDLNINPFLIRILAKEMGLNDSKSIVKWLFSQRVERSFVTSFGIALQEAAKVFTESTSVESAGILKTKDSHCYHMKVINRPIQNI